MLSALIHQWQDWKWKGNLRVWNLVRTHFHRGCCLSTGTSTPQVAWSSIDLAATIAQLYTCDEYRHLRTGIIHCLANSGFAGKQAATEVGEG